MRKYVLAAVLSVMMLASGCSSKPGNISIEPAGTATRVRTTAAVTAAEESEEGKADEGTGSAVEESLKAREEKLDRLEESLEAAEESLKAVEESIQEVMRSMTAEETEIEGSLAVTYSDLLGAPHEYLDRELTYSGSVIQSAFLSDGALQLLIAVDGDESAKLVGEFAGDLRSGTLGHGDTVTVTGTFIGVYRYLTGDGEQVELPSLRIGGISVDSVAETEPVREEETAAPETTAPTLPYGPLGQPD